MLENRLEKIFNILDKNKAEDIEVFDLKDSNYFVDSVILATANSNRHSQALLNYLSKDLKGDEKLFNIESSDDWIVVDLIDVLIHIMSKEYRVKYDMDEFLSKLKKAKEVGNG